MDPPTPYLRAEQRYKTDTTYRTMVDLLTSVIAQLQMTPAEVREAAIYACIRFEHLNIPYRQAGDMLDELNRCEARAQELKRWLRGGEDD